MQGLWGAPPAGLPGVLAYHKVGTAELGGTWCTSSQFKAHLDALLDAGYQTVDTSIVQRALALYASGAAAENPGSSTSS